MSKNQCDGCCAGMPMRGNLHVDLAGRAVMACQADRYAKCPACLGGGVDWSEGDPCHLCGGTGGATNATGDTA